MSKLAYYLKKQSGQTMVDLVVAMALLSMAVSSAGALATTSSRVGGEAGRRTQATALATRELEGLRNLRDTSLRVSQSDWPFAAGCQYFVMARQGANWTMQPRQNTNDLKAYDPADDNNDTQYDTSQRPGGLGSFRRIVRACDGRDYNANSGSYSTNNIADVKLIEVIVAWDEDKDSRQVELHTVLTRWRGSDAQ